MIFPSTITMQISPLNKRTITNEVAKNESNANETSKHNYNGNDVLKQTNNAN